ncbi:carbon-nitrogen hydrolase family protein [Coralliovum pocilloporae]|uniref:carbon-nitrogen hydrolase family protein n=1 Tax=Coralliovum pocilloporae TaxID=3066369 RepID=UPI0033072427
MTSFRAACVQMCSGRKVSDNLKEAEALVRAAAGQGAHYVLTPEMTTIMELDRASMQDEVTAETDHEVLATFSGLARDLKIALHVGSVAVRLDDGHLANRAYLFGTDGRLQASYDKLHMFDVDLAGGESYRESASYQAGQDAVLADLPWGRLGFSICYDVRFPHLYRTYAKAGSDFVAIPAAFTEQTGRAHWHVLLRARAIETGCFVFSAAQSGAHDDGRRTYGHSMIIDPWGAILAEAEDGPGFITAEIDPQLTEKARSRIPALSHDRHFSIQMAGLADDAEAAS